MKVLTFDIGGTAIKTVLFEDDRKVIKGEIPSRATGGADLIKKDIFAYIKKLQNDGQKLDGIAISTAGMVDYKSGIISYANENIKNYIGFNRPLEIQKEFSLPTLVENDVKSAAMGELAFGAGKPYSTIFVLTVGTGIGGCLILNKKIYRGACGNAGEIGFIPFEESTIEKKASTSNILRIAEEKYPEKHFTNGKILFEAFDNNDPVACNLVDILTTNLAKLISTILLVVSPQAVIVGGGIAGQKEKLLGPVKEKIEKLIPPNVYESSDILTTKLKNESGCYGAYHLFKERYSK